MSILRQDDPSRPAARAPQSPAPAKAGDEGDTALLETAAKRWQAAWERERENIERAYADLRLLAGDDVEHWGRACAKPARPRAARASRSTACRSTSSRSPATSARCAPRCASCRSTPAPTPTSPR